MVIVILASWEWLQIELEMIHHYLKYQIFLLELFFIHWQSLTKVSNKYNSLIMAKKDHFDVHDVTHILMRFLNFLMAVRKLHVLFVMF